jgi:tocopherol O-methyltransferase
MTLQNAADGADDVDVVEKKDHAAKGTKDISSEYETPAPLSSTHLSTLKDRIRDHYEVASDYYYSLWYIHMA